MRNQGPVKIKWFVWVGGDKMPRTSTMRGSWGYDVTCICGWETTTGGAVRSYIERAIWEHKIDHEVESEYLKQFPNRNKGE